MKTKPSKDGEDFVLTWTFHFTTKGQPANPIGIASHELSEAVIWFHASRQLREGYARDDYSIEKIESNHTPAQHYEKCDMPPRNPDIRQCVLTKRIARHFEAEITQAGYEPKVA